MILPLKVVTDYTLLKSLIKIPKLITYLKEENIPCCGICDENLFGVMEFYDACMANNIKPIIGLNVKCDDFYVAFYAQNYQGYQNLLKIHTAKEKKENVLELDRSLFDNILIVLDVLDIGQYDRLVNIFKKDKVYVSYANEMGKLNAYLKTNKVIFAPLIKAFNYEDTKDLDILKAINKNVSLDEIEKTNYKDNHFGVLEDLTKEEEDNTNYFGGLCNLQIPKNERYIPNYNGLGDKTYQYLLALTKKGLAKRLNGVVPNNYVERLMYELNVIKKMGFVDYFLIVYDYVKYAKKNNILVGLGRGSAAGSLVSYTLGITEIDPIKYGLLFERFLNPERVTMPDIDIDFEDNKRSLVVNYVKQKYGYDKVANIMTFGTLKCKLVVRSVCKVLDVSNALTNDFVALLDANLSIKDNLENELVKNILRKNPLLNNVVMISLRLEGLKKHISTHAAGVVISSVEIDKVIPVYYNGEEMLTGVTMNYLEEIGLLKMDFLAISNLDIIANVLHLILKYTKQKLDLNKIDYNDSKVMELFQNADTVGIFQFESEGMKNFLRKLKPSSLDDIVMALAMYRPGPMDNIDTFIRRKNGLEKVTYLDPVLEPILKETYGIIVYQEQIMQILVKIANYSYAEADIIRRAMSKKKKVVIDEGRTDFVTRGSENGYKRDVLEQIYDLIVKFANYGFNKSHSVSYSCVCVQMAYLKCYYPIYFILYLLNNAIASTNKTKEYILMGKKYGIKILLPSVNKSTNLYQIENNYLRVPLSLIKNLGIEAVKTILKERENGPYTSYLDFISRTYGKSVNKKTYEALILAGAMDEFKLNHKTMINNLDTAINYASLVHDLDKEFVLEPVLEIKEDNSDLESRLEELESYGFYINNHPASVYQGKDIMKLEWIENNFDKYVTCVVLLEQIKKIKTKNNQDMAFIVASDETSRANFVIFSNELKEIKELNVNELVLIRGRVTKRFATYQVNINKIRKL